MKARIIKKTEKVEPFEPFMITIEFDRIEQYLAFNRVMSRYIKFVDKGTSGDVLGNIIPKDGEDAELANLFKEIKRSTEGGLLAQDNMIVEGDK